MLAHGVTVTEVAAALRQQNLELPGGRMNQGAQELTVRTMGKIADAQAFNDDPRRQSGRLRRSHQRHRRRRWTARRSSAARRS